MINIAHSLMGWNTLLSFALFGAIMLLGWYTLRTSFETTIQAISARATADLTRAHAELKGLCDRVDSLEQQLLGISQRVDRCEQELRRLTKAIQSRWEEVEA
jgi:peptidoglycan hydrolase CwlO-like protein